MLHFLLCDYIFIQLGTITKFSYDEGGIILDFNNHYENNHYIDNTAMDFSSMQTNMQRAPEQESKMGLAIASMVIGILSLTLCCVFGSLLGIIGLILGIVALAKKQKGVGMAISGIVTSVLGFLVGVLILIYVIVVAAATSAIMTSYEEMVDDPSFRSFIESGEFDIEDFESFDYSEF